MKVLGVSSHPDDAVLGCAGAIANHVRIKDEVFLLFLTRGEEGGDPKVRVKEAIESAKVLGVPKKMLRFENLSDTRLFENLRKTILAIERIVGIFQPDRVYTPSDKDRHQDHIAAAIATKAACRHVPQIFAYESPSTQAEFSPQVFIDISDVLSLKSKAIRLHRSQMGKVYTKDEAVKGLARFRGLQAGVKAAEAFEVYRIIL